MEGDLYAKTTPVIPKTPRVKRESGQARASAEDRRVKRTSQTTEEEKALVLDLDPDVIQGFSQ